VIRLPRPLDPVRNMKVKIGMILLGSGAAATAWFYAWQGWFPKWTAMTGVVVGLLTLQILAHGMTSPLREMTAAAQAMAHGDYSRRVRATSRDEVGQLADAFNQMAADLAAADRQRRELIANVSHELRTPITALQGILENIVDGVAEAEPAMMETALTQTERLGRLVTELLDLSRLDAGVVPMIRAQIDIPKFLHDVVREAHGCTRSSPICSTTRPGTARPAARSSCGPSAARITCCSRWPTRAKASRPPSATGSSSASPGASGRPTAAPVSAWPSPAG
jgi:HAMP domain-containing protein